MQLVELEVSDVRLKVVGLQDAEAIALVRSVDESLIYSVDQMHADHFGLLSQDIGLVGAGFWVGVGFERLGCLHFIGIINKVFALISIINHFFFFLFFFFFWVKSVESTNCYSSSGFVSTFSAS